MSSLIGGAGGRSGLNGRLGANRVAWEVGDTELLDAFGCLLDEGYRLALVACHDHADHFTVVYLLTAGHPDRRRELHLRVESARLAFPTLADVSFPAGRFEREVHDLFGLVPEGHPLPRRLVRHSHWPAGWYPMRHDAGPPPAFELGSDPYPFLKVEGTGVYEIPVGPVHAGMIEPGHFRFSVVGETILKLKARLWFVHRGIEKLFEGRDPYGGVQLAERISGDSAAAHSLAYALAVEDALGWEISAEAQIGRALVVEMERVYNHVADLGALANDVGYGIINSHALRIRERLLRLNEKLTGHRLLRDAISPGATNLLQVPSDSDMAEIAADASDLAEVVLANSTVRDRFRGTSVLSREDASQLGCLGYVARASGLEIDARVDHPHCRVSAEAKIHHGGDVLARFLIRRDELDESFRLIGELTSAYGPTRPGLFTQMPQVRGKSSGVGIVEGWRGTTVHRVEITDGHLSRVKVVDPSWFNWPALPVALRDTIVPDFPLTNKSFNLSYAGNDL